MRADAEDARARHLLGEDDDRQPRLAARDAENNIVSPSGALATTSPPRTRRLRRRSPRARLARFVRAMSDHVKKGQKYQNREAFKAHRNIKRAVRDVDAEAALKAKACGGVCRDARKRCARGPAREE